MGDAEQVQLPTVDDDLAEMLAGVVLLGRRPGGQDGQRGQAGAQQMRRSESFHASPPASPQAELLRKALQHAEFRLVPATVTTVAEVLIAGGELVKTTMDDNIHAQVAW
ncbi:MAG: hypothetical protein EON59_18180 [Alphaproteobacteria bacterium]|nr:MAG: hypothetical protein EON59_18180 [Alphaproteobacteria bacterium]